MKKEMVIGMIGLVSFSFLRNYIEKRNNYFFPLTLINVHTPIMRVSIDNFLNSSSFIMQKKINPSITTKEEIK